MKTSALTYKSRESTRLPLAQNFLKIARREGIRQVYSKRPAHPEIDGGPLPPVPISNRQKFSRGGGRVGLCAEVVYEYSDLRPV